jgi:hypothetical protein
MRSKLIITIALIVLGASAVVAFGASPSSGPSPDRQGPTPAAATTAEPTATPGHQHGDRGQHDGAAREDRVAGAEPGDDHGREAEPGDDRGGEAEPGDDRGASGHRGHDG